MKKIIKIISLLILLVAVGAAIFGAVAFSDSDGRFDKVYQVKVVDFPAEEVNDALLAEGKRLFRARGCADCHAANLAGKVMLEDGGAGVLSGTNLTAGEGGVGKELSRERFLKAVRHGLNTENKPLKWMPSHEYTVLNAYEVNALFAYVKSAPPVDREAKPSSYGPVIKVLTFLDQFPVAAELIDHTKGPGNVKVELGVEYGAYLAETCMGCHNRNLSGGPVPGVPPDFPPASNLTSLSVAAGDKPAYTEASFIKAMTEGKRPDGSDINEFMPWKNFSKMTDVELKSLWMYIKGLNVREYTL